MNKIGSNIIALLGVVTVVFGGYYLYSQTDTLGPRSAESEQRLEAQIKASQLFVSRSSTLDTIAMDTSILQFDVFNSLRSFSPPPDEYEVGRVNPFVPVTSAEQTPISITSDNQ